MWSSVLTAGLILSMTGSSPPQGRCSPGEERDRVADATSPRSANLDSFARDVVRGRANVTIVGDSLNHPGQATTLFVGYLMEWRPVRWRQYRGAVNSSASANGNWLEFSSTASYEYVRPGQAYPGREDLVGSTLFPIMSMSGTNWHGRAISSGVHRLALGDSSELFRNANTRRTFCQSDIPYRHRTLAIAARDPEYRIEWNLASRASRPGSDWDVTRTECRLEIPPGSSPSLVWIDEVLPGSTEGSGHQGSALLLDAGDPLDPNRRIGLGGTIVTEPTTSIGLGLDYVGEGGWRTEHHLMQPGDPDLPWISSSNGPYRGCYSDEAIARHLAAHETTHVMIMLGTNNNGVDANQPEKVVEEIDRIIDRYQRAQATLADGTNPQATLEFLVVSPYAASTNPFFPNFAEQLRSLAVGNVAFLDLHGLVRDRFGEYEEWSETLLRDGVHPNLDGARHFASLMWREFVDACGPRSDLDRDGDVDAADFGLLLVDWGRTGHPGPADLDGDGRVAGADLGMMLWELSNSED